MYFIYLAIFILAILTPKIVEEGAFFFSEEDVESLLILSFGALGFGSKSSADICPLGGKSSGKPSSSL